MYFLIKAISISVKITSPKANNNSPHNWTPNLKFDRCS